MEPRPSSGTGSRKPKTSRVDDTTHRGFTASTATASGFNPAFEHLVVDPDVSKKNLQILVQGETAAEGTGYFPAGTLGKTGSLPQTFLAGQPIPLTVRMVDDYWNLMEAPTVGQGAIYVQANDPYVTNPLVNSLSTVNGAATPTIQLKTQTVGAGLVLDIIRNRQRADVEREHFVLCENQRRRDDRSASVGAG